MMIRDPHWETKHRILNARLSRAYAGGPPRQAARTQPPAGRVTARMLRDAVFAHVRSVDLESIIATELPLPSINGTGAVADVLCLTAQAFTSWELKGDGDTMRRLPAQLPVYRSTADIVNVVAAPSLVRAAQRHVPEEVGLYTTDSAGTLLQLRPAKRTRPSILTMAHVLTRDELFHLLRRDFGLARRSRIAPKSAGSIVDVNQLGLGILEEKALAEEAVRPPTPAGDDAVRNAPPVRLSRSPLKSELAEFFAGYLAAVHGHEPIATYLRDAIVKSVRATEEFKREHPEYATRTSPVLLAGELIPHDNGLERHTFYFRSHGNAAEFYSAVREVGAYADALLDANRGSFDGRGEFRKTEARELVRVRVPHASAIRLLRLARRFDALPIAAIATLSLLANRRRRERTIGTAFIARPHEGGC